MPAKRKQLIVIVGPTAVGKTDIAFGLAKKLSTEIVSADSRQFYTELEIGTAKPDPWMLQEIKHHFINTLTLDAEYTAGQFERDALKVLVQIFDKKDVAIMVGGSGLYVQAVCEGLDAMPEIPPGIREKWNQQVAAEGLLKVREFVEQNDPRYYELVDKNNPARLIRAAEVIEWSGQPFSSFRSRKTAAERDFDCVKIGLTAERDLLYQRIDQRIDLMIEAGLFAEAERYFNVRHLQALQTVGYQEIFGYLEGKYDKAEAVRLLKRNSRHYAKRQLTWFKKDDGITWFDRGNDIAIDNWLNDKGILL